MGTVRIELDENDAATLLEYVLDEIDQYGDDRNDDDPWGLVALRDAFRASSRQASATTPVADTWDDYIESMTFTVSGRAFDLALDPDNQTPECARIVQLIRWCCEDTLSTTGTWPNHDEFFAYYHAAHVAVAGGPVA